MGNQTTADAEPRQTWLKFKILLLGSHSVGKSSVFTRWLSDRVQDEETTFKGKICFELHSEMAEYVLEQ